jgi:hypothetical protein
VSGSRGANPALRLAAIRQFHAYLGAFIAPSILFFAVTGAWQLFNLHEAHGTYRPPALMEKLSAVHKDQRFAADDDHHGPPPGAGHHAQDADAGHKHEAAKPARAVTLKWLFLTVAVGLIVSTLLGLWMALAYSRRKVVTWVLLILGAALPVLILTL